MDQFVCRGYSLGVANRLAGVQWLVLALLGALDGYASLVYESGRPFPSSSATDWLARLLASIPSIVIIIIIIIFVVGSIINRAAARRRGTQPL